MKCATCGYDDKGTGDSAHMCSTKPYLPRDCKHGQLARSREMMTQSADAIERLSLASNEEFPALALSVALSATDMQVIHTYLGAHAIQAQAPLKDENAQLKAELAATKEWSRLNNEAAVDMGKQCRELAAELAAMRDQNPFAWYDPSADKFTRDRDDPNMNRGAVLWRLFLDAGAKP